MFHSLQRVIFKYLKPLWEGNHMVRQIATVLLAIMIATPALAATAVKIKGRIIGETCAIKGKIGECYLNLANPMVLWTEKDEEFYKIRIAGNLLDQVSLDKAFGLEVEILGWVAKDYVNIRKMTVLNPPGKKEFFKG